MRARLFAIALVLMTTTGPGQATTGLGQANEGWVASWAASAHGPYPSGNPSAQPDQRLTFPVPAAGARDQTFRLIVRPDRWGRRMRFRLSNAFGTRPVTFAEAHVGVQQSGAAVLRGTNRPVRFQSRDQVTVPAGGHAWSDAVELPYVTDPAAFDGRKLAVTFRIVGESGPMTWHAKALQTSYLTASGAPPIGGTEDDLPFPFSTTSWFFLDAVDVMAPAGTEVVVAFGDSITDGTNSTLNGDDRWPDVLSRRLHARFGTAVTVVNAGIGGNRITGPPEYSATSPVPGGPAAGQRLERDVLSLSGVTTVIWLEGINDLSRNDAPVEAIVAEMRSIVGRMRAAKPGIRVIGATVVSALGATNAAYGSAEVDAKRQALNSFIRTSGLFDHVADFDAVMRDPATGQLKAAFVPDSTTGGPGDRLHPNRAGYLAMGQSLDLDWFAPRGLSGR
jgi:lysophospholipase L1-like esterase